MLMVFIDTNIFFNNWYLRNPNFDVLANYLGNTGASLLLSDVVRLEVEAKFVAERKKLATEIADRVRRAADYQRAPVSIATPPLSAEFDFLEVVASRFENVTVVPVDSVTSKELLPRAISPKRPFREGEKGFRDTLIWMSLLAHLRNSKRSDIKLLFVTANIHDYFEKSSTGAILHQDLKTDLLEQGLSAEIVPYLSIRELIAEEVDLGLHSFSHEQFKENHGDEMEAIAEEAAEAFLADLPLTDLHELLIDAGLPAVIVGTIRSFTAQNFQGAEDPEVTSFKKLSDETIYIGYTFNLLTVVFTVVVDADDYYRNQMAYDDYFINPVVDGSSVSLEVLRRCDFEGGLSYRRDTSEFTSATIDRASVRPEREYRW